MDREISVNKDTVITVLYNHHGPMGKGTDVEVASMERLKLNGVD